MGSPKWEDGRVPAPNPQTHPHLAGVRGGWGEGRPARPAWHFLREVTGLALSRRADYCSPKAVPGYPSKQGSGGSTPSSGPPGFLGRLVMDFLCGDQRK